MIVRLMVTADDHAAFSVDAVDLKQWARSPNDVSVPRLLMSSASVMLTPRFRDFLGTIDWELNLW